MGTSSDPPGRPRASDYSSHMPAITAMHAVAPMASIPVPMLPSAGELPDQSGHLELVTSINGSAILSKPCPLPNASVLL